MRVEAPGAGRVPVAYLRAAQAYMLISMPTGTSTIFGVFQAISDLQVFGATPNGGEATSAAAMAQACVAISVIRRVRRRNGEAAE